MKLDSFENVIKWLTEAITKAVKAIQEFYGWFNEKKDAIEEAAKED